jgi:hypothetical protein
MVDRAEYARLRPPLRSSPLLSSPYRSVTRLDLKDALMFPCRAAQIALALRFLR